MWGGLNTMSTDHTDPHVSVVDINTVKCTLCIVGIMFNIYSLSTLTLDDTDYINVEGAATCFLAVYAI